MLDLMKGKMGNLVFGDKVRGWGGLSRIGSDIIIIGACSSYLLDDHMK